MSAEEYFYPLTIYRNGQNVVSSLKEPINKSLGEIQDDPSIIAAANGYHKIWARYHLNLKISINVWYRFNRDQQPFFLISIKDDDVLLEFIQTYSLIDVSVIVEKMRSLANGIAIVDSGTTMA